MLASKMLGALNSKTGLHTALAIFESPQVGGLQLKDIQYIKQVRDEWRHRLATSDEEHAVIDRVARGEEQRGDREVVNLIQWRAETPDVAELFKRAARFDAPPSARALGLDPEVPADVTRDLEVKLAQAAAVKAARQLEDRQALDAMILARHAVNKAVEQGRPTEVLREKERVAEEGYRDAHQAFERAHVVVMQMERQLATRRRAWQMQQA